MGGALNKIRTIASMPFRRFHLSPDYHWSMWHASGSLGGQTGTGMVADSTPRLDGLVGMNRGEQPRNNKRNGNPTN